MTDRGSTGHGAPIEKVFTVAVPRARVWRAFTDSHERSQWEAEVYEIDPVPGGKVHWILPGIEAHGVVEEVEPYERLSHREGDGPHGGSLITVTLEDAGTGTKVTITHAGFGDGWDEWFEGTSLGWSHAIADLVCYLTTGVAARRFNAGMRSPGMTMRDTLAGVVVDDVQPDGLAAGAGLATGDLLLELGGVTVFTISDVWVVMRRARDGEVLEVVAVRDGGRVTGSGAAGSW
jgi:uncharacterized protein YndB with AHSA1/START domain